MTDYYKILNIDKKASEKEIKTSFRKLAVIHHPDKNGGSKKSEEVFKSILVAYETLIDSNKRAAYDLKLYQFQNQKASPPPPRQNYSSTKEEFRRPTQQTNASKPHKDESSTSKFSWFNLKFRFFTLLILLEVIYLFFREPSKTSPPSEFETQTTSEKSKTDQELEKQKPKEPNTGELDF